jgi:type I protein arginine methyltransferase
MTTPQLTQQTVLQRVSNCSIRLGSNNNLQIAVGEQWVKCGSHGLRILEAFTHPTSLSEAVAKLQKHVCGAQDWVDLMSTIEHLYKAGVLQEETDGKPILNPQPRGFDSLPVHIMMLNDHARTKSYIAAINEVVRPEDIVLDIGTGTGILAMSAAKAGAKHVYAIEATPIGQVAKAMFKANGVEDKITLLQGWSTQLQLPERADVLVSEIIGNEPLAENVLQVTGDAVHRLLKPNARLIPSKVKIYGLPVIIPQSTLIKHTCVGETLQQWKSWYGLDFTPLATTAQRDSQLFFINPQLAKEWKQFSDPVLLMDADLRFLKHLNFKQTATSVATSSGEVNGILICFELELSPSVQLSTHPQEADESNCWKSPVWILGEPLSLMKGNRFTLTYTCNLNNPVPRISIQRCEAISN